jgi:hypothetical protein
MNRYEVKYFDKEEWEEISEIDLLTNFCETFDRVTPAVQEMIKGKHVLTPQAVYRVKGK